MFQILKEKWVLTWVLMIACFVAIYYGYAVKHISYIFMYNDIVMLGCGGWIALEALKMFVSRSYTGIVWALVAAVAGGGSFIALKKYGCLMCHYFGPSSGEAVWYYGSDIAIACLVMWVLGTHKKPSSAGVAVAGADSDDAALLVLPVQTKAEKPAAFLPPIFIA